jgi:hypothetical protein
MIDRRRWRLAAAVLVLIGCGGMIADLCGLPSLKGLLSAWGGSVLPKVFSTADGLETFSSTVRIRLTYRDGRTLEVPLDKNLASHLHGPYNRRNVYGAILVYGPVLQNHPKLGPMVNAMIQRSAQEGSPLLQDFHLSRRDLARIEFTVVPKHPHGCPHLQLTRVIDFEGLAP